MIKLIIFVTYGACWVCLCCHNPPISDMDYYRIFIMCTDTNACDCTWGCTDTKTESALWKLTLGRKSLPALGNWTFISGMMVQCSNQLSYIPSHRWNQQMELMVLEWYHTNNKGHNRSLMHLWLLLSGMHFLIIKWNLSCSCYQSLYWYKAEIRHKKSFMFMF